MTLIVLFIIGDERAQEPLFLPEFPRDGPERGGKEAARQQDKEDY